MATFIGILELNRGSSSLSKFHEEKESEMKDKIERIDGGMDKKV